MSNFAPKRILCPVDLSAASNSVLSWARLAAEVFGSRVEVIHADWPEAPRYFTEGQLQELDTQEESRRKALEERLQGLSEKVLGSRVPYSISVVEGHAIDVIVGRLKQSPPDLLIMGSHGRSGVARFLLGSVAENVAREAHLPTLIVRGPEFPADLTQLQRVLCPVKLSEASRKYVETASSVATALGAELTVLHSAEERGAAGEETRQNLCESIPASARTHCHISEAVVKGDAAEETILFARRDKTDLIVLGAERKPFLELNIFGRTTERVLRHGPSSVLLLPGAPDGEGS